jgi:membrane associated rhomboid family serine protease
VKPLLFTIGVSAFAWTSAEYWRINKYYIRKEYQRHIRDLYASWGLEDPYPAPYRGRIQPASRENSIVAKYPFLASFTPAQKLLLPMIGICCAITALWHYPVFGYRFMYKNFAHFHESGISRTLLTSAFSHASLAHLGFNMLALWSFADAAYPLLGPEYFMATVVSGAVVASMAQHAYGLMLHSGPALGASGFVFSLVTYVALTYPNNQALFFFVIPVPLLALVKGLVVFDVIGLTGIWSMAFNFHLAHAAHIGGVALGAAVWWLHQLDNRRRMAKALPEEAVGLYNKTYDAVFKR